MKTFSNFKFTWLFSPVFCSLLVLVELLVHCVCSCIPLSWVSCYASPYDAALPCSPSLLKYGDTMRINICLRLCILKPLHAMSVFWNSIWTRGLHAKFPSKAIIVSCIIPMTAHSSTHIWQLVQNSKPMKYYNFTHKNWSIKVTTASKTL